jgi:hypothetical protein
MDANDVNSDGAISKIEKIRLDLEKKLAALEAVKLKSTEYKADFNIEKKQIGLVGDLKSNTKLEEIILPKKESITSHIIDLNAAKYQIPKVNATKKEVISEETFFEINDRIENLSKIEKQPANSKNSISLTEERPLKEGVASNKDLSANKQEVKNVKSIVAAQLNKSVSEEKKIEVIKNKKVVQVGLKENTITKIKLDNSSKPKTFFAKEKKLDNTLIESNKPAKKKKSNLNYIIFGLVAVVILATVFVAWNYFSQSVIGKSNNKILSEYENRIFKDSIKLADANNLLSDLQSRKYIDSLANANQIRLESNFSKKVERKSFFKNIPKNNKNVSLLLPTKSNNVIANPQSNNSSTNDNSKNSDESELNPVANKDIVIDNKTPSDNNFDVDVVNKGEKSEKEELTTNNIDDEKIKNKNSVVEKAESKPKAETISTIEKSPIYPGCERKATEVLKKRCLMSKIQSFVSRKFNSDLSQDLGLSEGRKKINVSFIIDKSGKAKVLNVRGQHKVLEKEAARVISSLPKMKPGKKNGKATPIVYNLPIVYKIEY